jgi:hypothetical protein
MRPLPALLLFLVVLLGLGVAASVLAPDEVTDPEAARTRTVVVPPPAPRPDRVTATLPRRAPVRARTGDVVVLTVSPAAASRPDILEARGLGHEAFLGPDVANVLSFVADRAGRFPLTAQDAGRRLGVLVVRERADRG